MISAVIEFPKKDVLMRIIFALAKKSNNITSKEAPETVLNLDDGKKISGSLTASMWLLERSNAALLGTNEIEKAQVYQWSATALSEINKSFAEHGNAMKDLNETLSHRTFIATNQFSLADICLYSTLYKTAFLPNDRIETPHVIRFFDLIQHLVLKHADAGLEIASFDLNYPLIEAAPKVVKADKKADKGAEKKDVAQGKSDSPKGTDKPKKEKAFKAAGIST
jgi:Glutathione S-transferase, C-terminal domain